MYTVKKYKYAWFWTEDLNISHTILLHVLKNWKNNHFHQLIFPSVPIFKRKHSAVCMINRWLEFFVCSFCFVFPASFWNTMLCRKASRNGRDWTTLPPEEVVKSLCHVWCFLYLLWEVLKTGNYTWTQLETFIVSLQMFLVTKTKKNESELIGKEACQTWFNDPRLKY